MNQVQDLATQAQGWFEPVIAWLTVQGLSVVYAALVLFVGWRIAGWVKHLSERWMDRTDYIDPMVEQFLGSLAYYLVLAVVVITVLHLFGVQTTSLVAVLGAASLAIGLALQGSLTSLAAGVMILAIRPFKHGDYIQVAGYAGTVKRITLFLTELATFDNIQVILPNSACWGTAVTNYSVYPTRMLDIDVGIDYGDEIGAGLETLLKIAADEPRILAEPAAGAFVDGLGESSVNLRLRVWCSASDYWPLKRALTRRVKEELEAAGLSIPFPHRTLVGKEEFRVAARQAAG